MKMQVRLWSFVEIKTFGKRKGEKGRSVMDTQLYAPLIRLLDGLASS